MAIILYTSSNLPLETNLEDLPAQLHAIHHLLSQSHHLLPFITFA